MAIAFVQAAADDYSADYNLMVFLTGTTVGNHIIVFSYCGTGVTTNSCTDNGSNSYSQVLAGMTNRMKVYVAEITSGGDRTVTVAFNSNSDSFRRIIAMEYSGLDPADPYDTGAMPTGTWAGTTATDGAHSYEITPTNNGALIIGTQKLNTSGTIAAGTGFTERIELTQYEAEDLVQDTAAAIYATWTNSAANPFYPLITAWNPAVSNVDFTHTGAIVGTESLASNRSIEKVYGGTPAPITDNFNRTNENPITGDWVSLPGTTESNAIISGNQVASDQTGSTVAVTIRSAGNYNDNQYSQIKITSATIAWAGCIVRGASTGSPAYLSKGYVFGCWTNGFGLWVIDDGQAWNWTDIATNKPAVAFAQNDVVRIVAYGNRLFMYQNGVLFYTMTDNYITSGGRPGLIVKASDTADDWEGGNVVGVVADADYDTTRTFETVRVSQLVEQRYLRSLVTSEHIKSGTLLKGQAWNSYVEFLAGLVLQQEGFRFRNDNGTEATATWKYAQDTNMTGASNTPFRVRFVINATGDPGARNWQLEYRRAATDNWRKVN